MSDPASSAGSGAPVPPTTGTPGPARSRTVVLATGAALLVGVVTGLALWAGVGGDPERSAARDPDAERRPPVDRVDWTRVVHPIACGSLPVRLLDVEVTDLTGDGAREAVVLARCDSGAGSPPSALFVYDHAPRPGERAEPADVLLRAREDVLMSNVTVTGGVVRGTAYAYSSPDVPRCCPDRRLRVTWTWTGSRFVREAEPVTTGQQAG